MNNPAFIILHEIKIYLQIYPTRFRAWFQMNIQSNCRFFLFVLWKENVLPQNDCVTFTRKQNKWILQIALHWIRKEIGNHLHLIQTKCFTKYWMFVIQPTTIWWNNSRSSQTIPARTVRVVRPLSGICCCEWSLDECVHHAMIKKLLIWLYHQRLSTVRCKVEMHYFSSETHYRWTLDSCRDKPELYNGILYSSHKPIHNL